jgi:heat shock protein HslJ
MRRLLALALTLIPAMSTAQDMTETDWRLLAIDGVVVGYDVAATLRIGADGTIAGKAPCNSYSAANKGPLPTLSLGGIRATRMACDKLDQEQAFFDALSAMAEARMDGSRNLILTGPEGRSMEFVLDLMNSLTKCTTCPDAD